MNARLPLLLLALSAPAAAHADDAAPDVTFEVLAQGTADGARLGLRHTVQPGWHIYWENPGESGMATSAAVQVPDGWTAGPLQFPVPSRFGSEIVGYGYAGEVTFLVDLVATSPAPAGTATVTSRWLACQEICVPGSAEATVDLTSLPREQPALAAAAALIPTAATPSDGLTVTLVGEELAISVAGATRAEFFPSVDLEMALGGMRPPFLREEIVNGAAKHVLKAHLSGPLAGQDLRGVLRLVLPTGQRHITVQIPAPSTEESP